MSELIDVKTADYIEKYSSPTDDLGKAVLKKTEAEHAHAHMISGAVQGKFLEMISMMVKPRRVLEIGAFTGFSGLCLAAGLVPGGELHSIEIREADAITARENFDRSEKKDALHIHTGDAKEIVAGLYEEWDLVFIDADKTSYIDYYELTLPKVKHGGFIIADNVLFHGQVTAENITGKNAKAVHAFNEHVAADNRTEQVILSIRDGLSLIRKK